MSDLISRSDAIGAVKEERFPIDSDYAEGFMAALDKVEWILKEWLPSAQPETHEERTETHSCDLIERQEAIDALDCISGVEEVLRSLPSAQPEIILCKDCKYWMRAYLSISGKHGCNVMRDYTAPDDYCFKAKRKA